MKAFFLLLFLASLSYCTDESGSRNALQSMGFKNIQFQGYSFFGCGKDDFFHTAFTALNQNNQSVQGVVCCGWFKNCTVRF